MEHLSSGELIEEIERLRAQLQEAESRLAETQRIARLGYWERDLRANRDWWSDEYYRLFGMSPGQVEPTFERFMELVHPEDRDAVHRAQSECLARRGPCELTYRVVLPDATRRVFHTRAEAEFDSAGHPTRVFGTTLDVTELRDLQQALSESEARWRSIFEQVPLGIVLTGADRRMRVASPAWSRMTGYSAEELATLTSSDITHPDDLGETTRLVERAQRGESESFCVEKRYVRKNGEVFWGRTTGTTIRPGGTEAPQRIVIIQDITDQKEIELRQSEFRKQQRETLVREVHHRIKNNLQGVASLLERHATATPALRHAIDEALTRLNTLAMIHGLQGAQTVREINLCSIVRGIVQAAQTLSPVPVEFKIPYGFVPAEVATQETVPIALILNELVSNAVRHVDASGRPLVTIRLSRAAERVVIVVRSEPAVLPRGFDLAADRTLGTGLRLAKSLLPAQGARLSIRVPDEGAVEAALEISPPVLNPAGRFGAIGKGER